MAAAYAQSCFERDILGTHYLVDVEEMFNKGIANPDLPRLDADIITRWGYTIPEALLQSEATGPAQEEPAAAVEVIRRCWRLVLVLMGSFTCQHPGVRSLRIHTPEGLTQMCINGHIAQGLLDNHLVYSLCLKDVIA